MFFHLEFKKIAESNVGRPLGIKCHTNTFVSDNPFLGDVTKWNPFTLHESFHECLRRGIGSDIAYHIICNVGHSLLVDSQSDSLYFLVYNCSNISDKLPFSFCVLFHCGQVQNIGIPERYEWGVFMHCQGSIASISRSSFCRKLCYIFSIYCKDIYSSGIVCKQKKAIFRRAGKFECCGPWQGGDDLPVVVFVRTNFGNRAETVTIFEEGHCNNGCFLFVDPKSISLIVNESDIYPIANQHPGFFSACPSCHEQQDVGQAAKSLHQHVGFFQTVCQCLAIDFEGND
mmetsp:Transcript_386/g.2974  ORF Transcript_386/g.2974 Transcript_386/m.2974 type:complete len:286 (-) Transcript_386:251-1108(-)